MLRILLCGLLCLGAQSAIGQANSGPDADIRAIHQVIEQYAKAVDTLDVKLLSQVWSHSAEVSFVYPLGEEHGFEAIQQNVFQNVMGKMFATRELQVRDVEIHVHGNSAWSEFHWTFHASLRKDGSAVTTRGVESQVYFRESGRWKLVHVHYSEERQSLP